MGIVCLIIGLFILMAMCMKGIHVFIAVFVTSLFLATTAWITSPGTINPLDTILKVYTAGVGGYFGNFLYFLFLAQYLENLPQLAARQIAWHLLLSENLVRKR